MTTKSNAEKQGGKGTPKMEVKKDAAKSTQAAKPQEPTKEELQKMVAELTKKLESVPRDLNSRIEYFNEKKELIRRLTNVEGTRDGLQEHLDALAEISAENEFENDYYILTIEGGANNYNKKQVFAIKNPVLIGDVITYLIGKTESKIDVLKKQIAD